MNIDLGGLTCVMTWFRKMKTMVVLVIVVALLSLTACGGGASEISSAPSSEPTPAPAPTTAPDPTVVPKTTKVLPTATAVPPTATPTPTSTPEPPVVLDEFGFSLGLDRGAYVTNLPGNTDAQGMVQLEYHGVNVILSWVPINGVTNEGLVSGMFGMLQDNQPDLTLETVSESNFNVGLETGLVIGFKSSDSSGEVAGGGLIGAWNCLDEETSYTITVTGEDAAVVQLRFNRLISNFACS